MLAVSLVGVSPNSALFAQDSTGKQKYSQTIVDKATKILEQFGLKRSANAILSNGAGEISRGLTGLSRERRKIKLLEKDLQKATDQVDLMKQTVRQLTIQDGELNLQLARAGDDEVRMVGLINAGRTKIKLLNEDLQTANAEVAKRRSAVGDAESKYAETILAVRKDYEKLGESISKSLQNEKVKIALGVMHRNFQTPAQVSAETILKGLKKRIDVAETAVLKETIALTVDQSGSMLVDVVVGKKKTRMVIDSGATLVSLPSKIAKELGVEVPAGAQVLRLVMADGRTIQAHAVRLARVRVGQFEAENVAAAVLEETASGAEPLLGMSYLGNFKFEINATDKTLKMLRVELE